MINFDKKKNTIILLAIFLVSCVIAAFAQTEEPMKTVTAIEIKGNKTISTAKIIAQMKTRIGEEYSQNVISSDIKRIFNMGFFSDVKVDREDYVDGFRVIFYLTEKPIIESISFEGARVITTRKLKQIIKSKTGEFLDYQVLKEDIKNIEDEYKKRGFSLSDIKYDIKLDDKTNRTNVIIMIQESVRIRIEKINFVGNNSFKNKQLLKLIKTRTRRWFFSAGFYNKEVLTEDVERLKSYYKREGFLDVKVSQDSQIKQKGLMYLTFYIEEGTKYFVGNIVIKGNSAISKEDILSKVKECLPGKTFSGDFLQVDIDKIKEVYFDKGYIFADVQAATSLDAATGKVNIDYNIVEGEV
ncbi:MAG: hypothetical protein FJZ11_06745, partial [Candidatus Omnitrophica bacterium]|nr:hypothetical protein [Candidatus Omnitrophota bacterium]